jgi:hypothetical protein
MTPEQIEVELKKLTVMPPWERKQSEEWESLSKFVYQLPTYERLQDMLGMQQKGSAYEHYCIHKWFNTLSARALEELFCRHPRVRPNKSKYDKLIDFSIKTVPFDHKTSTFPQHYPHSQAYAEANPASLIEWLYEQQGKQGRFHLENRLFVVLYAEDGEHWRLRSEIGLIESSIGAYLEGFKRNNLSMLLLEGEHTVLSDIIWVKG